MIKKMNMINILLGCFLALLCGCVGTIEDKAPSESLVNAESTSTGVEYTGLMSATAISHNKVELKFLPGTGASKLLYNIYLNRADNPITKVSSDNLQIDGVGLYRYTIGDLVPNTSYNFYISTLNPSTGKESVINFNKDLSAKTFANETANFTGVKIGYRKPGIAGMNTAVLEWVPASFANGSSFISPKAADPIAYEVKYIPSSSGPANINDPAYTGGDVLRVVTPAEGSWGSNPLRSDLNSVEIPGLSPGTQYAFQVRAIHKGYADFGDDADTGVNRYRREENTAFVEVTTLSAGSTLSFDTSSLGVYTPSGEDGRTSVDLKWASGDGEFFGYKIFYRKIADPPDVIFNTNDQILKADIGVDPDIVETGILSASLVEHRLSGLNPYAYYQAKIGICTVADCSNFELSSLPTNTGISYFRIEPYLSSFSGIASISSPNDVTNLNSITVEFDSPVVTQGFLTELAVYCYADENDTTPIKLDYNVPAVDASNCNNATLKTDLIDGPANLGLVNSLNIDVAVVDGQERYCFSVIPIIDENPAIAYTNIDPSSAVVKCITPVHLTPSIIEFPGLNTNCSTNIDSIDLTWLPPLGGLYDGYRLLYRKTDDANFTFLDALAYIDGGGTHQADGVGGYGIIDLAPGATSANIPSLVPGTEYTVGILTTLSSVPIQYSQNNINIINCAIDFPKPTFNEWFDIQSLGRKENGMDPQSDGSFGFINEYFDAEGIPIDITDADVITRTGEFDGVYGQVNAQLVQASNNGMIRLVWEDVNFPDFGNTLDDFITLYEDPVATKNDRLFGYKVYRSDDNQLTWKDLTTSAVSANQTAANSGLVHPKIVGERTHGNNASVNFKVAEFFDYSVASFDRSGHLSEGVDRGRIYYYKIVPVFNGRELPNNDATNHNHHIIKVILPPANMALVHRYIANRMMCLSLGKSIDKSKEGNYSCDYNGVGATKKGSVWTLGQSIYDQRDHLLVDRFELGCQVTRGSPDTYTSVNLSPSKSSQNAVSDFDGMNDLGGNFVGCNASSSTDYFFDGDPPNSISNGGNPTLDPDTVWPGDCSGINMIKVSQGDCSALGPGSNTDLTIKYPGIGQGNFNVGSPQDLLDQCDDSPSVNQNSLFDHTDPNSLYQNNITYSFPAQSELGGVYHVRDAGTSGNKAPITFRAPDPGNPSGEAAIADNTVQYDVSSCFINLQHKDSGGKYFPRWFPANILESGEYKHSITNNSVNILDQTMDQIHANTDFYGGDDFNVPTLVPNRNRFDSASTPIGKIISANSAKLPPLTQVPRNAVQKICGLYEVEVGYTDTSNNFAKVGETKEKRMLRRSEFLVASSWNSDFSGTKILNLESGNTGSEPRSCNTTGRGIGTPGTPLNPGNSWGANSVKSSGAKGLVVTGSSALDSTLDNTERCVSRWGVQDMVGNGTEVNSDLIYCDFTLDKLKFGAAGGNNFEVANEGKIEDVADGQFYVESQPDSGSCSPVRKGIDSGPYVIGGTIIQDIYNIFTDSYDLSILEEFNTTDPSFVDDWRNGDGSFLDFGQSAMAPPLKDDDALRIDSNFAANYGKYFSPILGLPLTCADPSACGAFGLDNKLISTTQLVTQNGGGGAYDGDTLEFNYPIGNSEVYSYGSSSVSQDAYSTSGLNYGTQTVITGIDGAGDPITEVFTQGMAPARTHYQKHWKVSRSLPFHVISGGSVELNRSGRYTVEFANSGSGRAEVPRCMVRVQD